MREARQECSKVYNRGHWSKAEHERFIQGVQQHGRDWKKVSEEVGSRSSNQIRSHAQKHFLKLDRKRKLPSTHEECNHDNCLPYSAIPNLDMYLQFMQELQMIYSRPQQMFEPVKIVNENGEIS